MIVCFCKAAYKYAKIGKEETKKKKREERKKKRSRSYGVAKKRVPEEVKIGRSFTPLIFLITFGRPPRDVAPRRESWTLTPYPSREGYSGMAPPPPFN